MRIKTHVVNRKAAVARMGEYEEKFQKIDVH